MLSPVHTTGHMVLTKDRDLGWRGRWLAWRNGILSSPKFQRFALRFPLTRPIARRRARALFDLVAGFTYSQILAACVQTRLLERLRDGPHDAAAIAARDRLAGRGCRTTVARGGGAGTGRTDRRAVDAWAAGRGVARQCAGSPRWWRIITCFTPTLPIRWRCCGAGAAGAQLSAPLALCRVGGRGRRRGDVAAYSALMAASQPLVAEQIIAAYPFLAHRRMLDVGGGQGVFVAAVAAAVPRLELGLFDLPAVVARARSKLERGRQCSAEAFWPIRLPTGFDLITLVRVLHDHDDGPALGLAAARPCRAADRAASC